jgi:hypothetical protein
VNQILQKLELNFYLRNIVLDILKKCIIQYTINLLPKRKTDALTAVHKLNFFPSSTNLVYAILFTLSPISDTNINVNAAVKPDFAIAAKSDEGPPFTKATSENTKAHANSTRAIEKG